MTDQDAIDELIDRFRARSDPAHRSLETATDIVATAWPTLDDAARAKLVASGSRLMRDGDDLLGASLADLGASLSGEVAARIWRAPGCIRYVPGGSADGADGSSEAIGYVDFVDPSRGPCKQAADAHVPLR